MSFFKRWEKEIRSRSDEKRKEQSVKAILNELRSVYPSCSRRVKLLIDRVIPALTPEKLNSEVELLLINSVGSARSGRMDEAERSLVKVLNILGG